MNRWLVRTRTNDDAHRLYCFSYAGGHAYSFREWQSAFPGNIEICAVQLPGRGVRSDEPPHTSMATLLLPIARVLAIDEPRHFSFFGHSMGGLMAFELARYLRHLGAPMPVSLFVSGCEAPRHRSPSRRLSQMDDESLIDALADFNGAPAEVLAHSELMALLLPITRADMAVVENYAYEPALALNLPIDVLAGTSDPHVNPETLTHWAAETNGPCRLTWFPGDHFFIHSQRADVLRFVRERLLERMV
ncbi:thioesterase domain protein [Xanthomonas citri pv. mangiferaeindicae LMG 941]|nr:thioesterase domain protein [Xanthomonas citri pv. mangiferaeindicae LMG 941]